MKKTKRKNTEQEYPKPSSPLIDLRYNGNWKGIYNTGALDLERILLEKKEHPANKLKKCEIAHPNFVCQCLKLRLQVVSKKLQGKF